MKKSELLKTAKPILFNTEMVKAILDGRKTVTRRAVKPKPEESAHSPYECVGGRIAFRIGGRACTEQYKPPYRPGDILYVRETWGYGYEEVTFIYKADDKLADLPSFQSSTKMIYRPSIHMPREAARIFLRVTDVRVERLQDITEEQAISEGCQPLIKSARYVFSDVWDSTIKPADRDRYGWDSNPWVWVVEFERIEVSDNA